LRHIAFIMDGNRRWADAHRLPRVRGHKEGIFAIERIVQGCIQGDIHWLTLFAFSTENWKRSQFELRYLVRLMFRYLWLLRDRKVGGALLEKVRISFIGDREQFGAKNNSLMLEIESTTKLNSGCHVIVAVSYGGMDEIVHAANKAISQGKRKLDREDINRNLYLPDVPFPDLVVRTGNSYRMSNFLIWQVAYSELMFLDKLWPDVSENDVYECKQVYLGRERKFGE